MERTRHISSYGFTLIEMTVTVAIFLILLLAVGVLFAAGSNAWWKTYDSANKRTKEDAIVTAIAFGNMARRANRLNYIVYKGGSGSLIPALPVTSLSQEVVWGDAVEFRYWDVPLDETDSYDWMDVSKTATAYALFYVDGDKLKVDCGPYPPGAAPDGGGPRNTAGVTTMVLAENVAAETALGAFSHTTVNGIGQGTVRTNILLKDPIDGETTKMMTATLIRSIWPR